MRWRIGLPEDSLAHFFQCLAIGAVGLRAEKPEDVDAVIEEMMATDAVVIADIVVDQLENCFPMIPSGAAHYEMVLGPDGETSAVSDAGLALV